MRYPFVMARLTKGSAPGMARRLGTYSVSKLGGEAVRAFIPVPLPPVPPVRLESLQKLMEQANQALGRLDGLASILPDLSLLIYMHLRSAATGEGARVYGLARGLPSCGPAGSPRQQSRNR